MLFARSLRLLRVLTKERVYPVSAVAAAFHHVFRPARDRFPYSIPRAVTSLRAGRGLERIRSVGWDVSNEAASRGITCRARRQLFHKLCFPSQVVRQRWADPANSRPLSGPDSVNRSADWSESRVKIKGVLQGVMTSDSEPGIFFRSTPQPPPPWNHDFNPN